MFSGPVRISPNGRYFVPADGKPFFWLGDTAWPLFSQYAPEDAESYLENRAANGFTVIQGVLAWGNGTGMENPQPDPNATGHRPWNDTPANPDPVYFEQVDRLLDIARTPGAGAGDAPHLGVLRDGCHRSSMWKMPEAMDAFWASAIETGPTSSGYPEAIASPPGVRKFTAPWRMGCAREMAGTV